MLASVLKRKCGSIWRAAGAAGVERLALELAALEREGQRLVARLRIALAVDRAPSPSSGATTSTVPVISRKPDRRPFVAQHLEHDAP